MKKPPAKRTDLMTEIRRCIESDDYLDSFHSSLRQAERNISRPEILYVLKTGYHEEKKDRYEHRYLSWNYAIRGKTLDGREPRVVVTFSEAGLLLIVTAIELNA